MNSNKTKRIKKITGETTAFATFNVRGLASETKKESLFRDFENYKIDLVFLQKKK